MLLSSNVGQALKCNGFHRKGSAFFRVLGDGIVQVIKASYERNGNYYDLRIGLFSLYSALESQWFTSAGCIPRYSMQNIIGDKTGPLLLDPRYKYSQISSQEEILLNTGISWLNSMKTQKDLIDGICHLETSGGGSINWVDSLKLVPFLLVCDFTAAKKVICAIKEQRVYGYAFKRQILSSSEYQQYLLINSESDTRLEYLLQLVNAGDMTKIQEYALENYATNMQYVKFCM